MGKFWPLPAFVNKVFLVHSHAHSLCIAGAAAVAELRRGNQARMSYRNENIYYLAFYEKKKKMLLPALSSIKLKKLKKELKLKKENAEFSCFAAVADSDLRGTEPLAER